MNRFASHIVRRLTVIAAVVVSSELGGRAAPADGRDSIVDYLNSKGRDPSLAGRAKLYEQKLRDAKGPYLGPPGQDMTLLEALLAEDREAREALAQAEQRLTYAGEAGKKASAPENSPGTISRTFRFPRWIPSEGFGVNGSWVARVTVVVRGNRIEDREFLVAVESAAAGRGRFFVTGSVDLYIDSDAPVRSFSLQPAWFPTIGAQGSTTVLLAGQRGIAIELPDKAARIRVRVTLHPVVSTTKGVVPLMGGSGDIALRGA